MRDNLGDMLILIFWAAVLLGIAAATVTTSVLVGLGWALVASLLGFPVWKYFGARPGPGFADGCICIWGYMWVLGVIGAETVICIGSLRK